MSSNLGWAVFWLSSAVSSAVYSYYGGGHWWMLIPAELGFGVKHLLDFLEG